MNKKLTGRGGPGRGQGRKPTGRKKTSLWLLPEAIAKAKRMAEKEGVPYAHIIERAISKLDEGEE